MMENAIRGAVAAGTKIGLCGQAPSDLPDFAAFLIKAGISSISFNPDALLQGIGNMVEAEKIHGKEPEIDTVSEGLLMDGTGSRNPLFLPFLCLSEDSDSC